MDVKLVLAKRFANLVSSEILRLIPEIDEPETEAGRFIEEVLKRLLKLASFWHAKNNLPDRNFETFLEAMKRTLVYIAENDDVYAHWLGLGIRVLGDQLDKTDLGDCGGMLYVAEGMIRSVRVEG